MPPDSNTIWEVLKTTLPKTTEEVFWTMRKNFYRETCGGMTVSVKLWLKGVFGRLGRRGKPVRRNTWLLREDLNMLSMLQKRLQRKRRLSALGSVIIEFSKLLNQDVSGEKYVLYDNENLCFDTAAKSNAWKEHHNCLLNQKFV